MSESDDENINSAESVSGSDGNKEDSISINDSDSSNSDVSSDDEVIDCIRLRQNTHSKNPKKISTANLINDISFHPMKDNIIALALQTGVVELYDVGTYDTSKVVDLSQHTDSCRGVDFFPDGNKMVSVAINGSISVADVNKHTFNRIALDPNCQYFTLKVLDSKFFATGEENGSTKLWDLRTSSPVCLQQETSEVINSIEYSENRRQLVCTTGEGELLVFDLRMAGRLKILHKSDPYTSELNDVSFVRSDNNVVCCSSQGDLLMFDWDPFAYQTFRPRKGDLEILSLLSVSENIVVAGYEDGKVSAIHLYPNQVLGIVGHHEWDVSKLDINASGNILASAANCVKFWDISCLEDVQSAISSKKHKKETDFPLPSSEIMSRKNFFSDLNDEFKDVDNENE